MPKLLPIVVLASGNGSNFQALIDAIREGKLAAEIRGLITDNVQAPALERARRAGIPSHVAIPDGDRTAYAQQLQSILDPIAPALICLAGFMRILAPSFIAAYRGRIMNIHPSLLPQFPGLHAVAQALAAGARETGCTVHWVDEGIDTGPIILQERVPILAGDTVVSLTERIHTAEHRIYPEAMRHCLESIIAKK